jgi:hypothetical protein
MGWKEAINTYPSSIVYEIHGLMAFIKSKSEFLSVLKTVSNLIGEPDWMRRQAFKMAIVSHPYCSFLSSGKVGGPRLDAPRNF